MKGSGAKSSDDGDSMLVGVEILEDSRFIGKLQSTTTTLFSSFTLYLILTIAKDHTNVTAWETLASRIQEYCKDVMRSPCDGDYVGSLSLEYYCEGQSHLANLKLIRLPPIEDRVAKIYSIAEHIALISDTDILSMTSSTKSYMLSSLITGTTQPTIDRPQQVLRSMPPAFLYSKSQRCRLFRNLFYCIF
jgi:hypothetical protein